MSQILPKSQKLYDLTINWQTENTNHLLSKSTNFLINYGFTHSPFGKALVMGTKQGICGIAFADQLGDEDTLLDMMQRWPRTTFTHNEELILKLSSPIFDFSGAGYPECEALLIVEVEGSLDEIDEQIDKIMVIAESLDPTELRRAKDEEQANRIWLGRKSAFGAMGQIADYMCLDGTIPVNKLPYVLKCIGEMSKTYGLSVANVFHAGDGNMHPLILYDANKPGELTKCEEFGAEILRLCVEVGGCLTGEHGVGIEKRELMDYQFTADDIDAQLRIKDVFDSKWLLNPLKVFPLHHTEARRMAFNF